MTNNSFDTLSAEAHFRTFDGPTVITKRNFGLLRGKTLQECPNMLVKTSQYQSTEVAVSPPPTPDSGCWSPSSSVEQIGPINEHRRGSLTYGMAGPCDRSTNIWEWPLGDPKVFNGEDYIEAQFNFFPFSPEEVWANVMGNELCIRCSSDSSHRAWIGQRDIYRCYTLPLNVNPRTAEFSIIGNRCLKIVVRKDLPLKLAIAFYEREWDEIELDDDRSDSEMIGSVTDDQISI